MGEALLGFCWHDQGNTWDHFSVIFTFPEEVAGAFASGQLLEGYGDIVCRMYGPKGTIDTHYWRRKT
jgi:hypothetical protein